MGFHLYRFLKNCSTFLCILFFATKKSWILDVFLKNNHCNIRFTCPLRGHYSRREAPARIADLLQKNISNKIFKFYENRKWIFEKRDFIWRPPKNTLLLWSKKNGFSNIGISQKLQYFFFCGFCFLCFLQQKKRGFWMFFLHNNYCDFRFTCPPSGAL
jgi:hypothetical protein